MGRVRCQARGHPVHADVRVVQVSKDIAQVTQAYAKMRIALPTTVVMGLEALAAQNLHSKAETGRTLTHEKMLLLQSAPILLHT